jgi:hypothetical protein
MSFIHCLRQKMLAGEITPQQLAKIEVEYRTLGAKYEAAHVAAGKLPQEAWAAAQAKMMDKLAEQSADVVAKMMQVQTNLMVRTKVEGQLRVLNDLWDANSNAYKTVMGGLSQKPTYADAAQWYLNNTDMAANELGNRYIGMMNDTIGDVGQDEFIRYMKSGADFANVSKEMLGKSTGDATAARMAKGFREVMERQNADYADAGGFMRAIPNYHPQVTLAERLIKTPKDEWFKNIVNKLDRNAIIDDETGLPMSDARLEKVASDIYDDITTDGQAKIDRELAEGKSPQKAAPMFRKRARERFFRFATPEDFIAYNNDFGWGEAGLSQAVLSHIRNTGRSISIMQRMGPMPSSAYNTMAARFQKGQGVANRTAEAMYDTMVGYMGDAIEGKTYKFIMGVQNLLRSAWLGGSIISSIPDPGTVGFAAKMNGLSVTDTIGIFFSANKDNVKLVANAANIAEALSHGVAAAARLSDGQEGKYFLSGTVQNVMNWSGQTAWTRNIENTASLSLASDTGLHVSDGVRWADLPEDYRKSAMASEIDEADWNRLLKIPTHQTADGGHFMPFELVRTTDMALGSKMALWDARLRMAFANHPDLKLRAFSQGAFFGDGSKGGAIRAVSSSLFMFKSFPIMFMRNFVNPIMTQVLNGKIAEPIAFAMIMTGLGAVTVQAKEVLKGRGLKDTDKGDFWMQAAMRGGAFGFVGEAILKNTDSNVRMGISGLSPVLGAASDASSLVFGNLAKALSDDEHTQWKKDTITNAARYVPYSTLWYAQRGIMMNMEDAAQQLNDSGYARKMREKERKRVNAGQDSDWWPRPNALPNDLR